MHNTAILKNRNILCAAILSALALGSLRPTSAQAQDLVVDGSDSQTITTPQDLGSDDATVGQTAGSNAALTIESGGALTDRISVIGYDAGSEGAVTVTGTGTWTTALSLVVGRDGTGTLNIENGGTVVGGGVATVIGAGEGSVGTATVAGTGSSWSSDSTIVVGSSGTGTLNILDGGAVAGGVNVGSVGSGDVLISGDGSKLDAGDDAVVVGDFGTGTLTISNGGALSNTADGVIGDKTDSTGTVTVTGENATWATTGVLRVGNAGNGTLLIADGGAVRNSFGLVGFSGTGTVTVTGTGSTWTNTSALFIGADYGGSGALFIDNGGAVSSSAASIGNRADSSGTVTVTGADSTWTNAEGFFVGSAGKGTLTLADGGTVDVDGGDGTIVVASQDGSTGTLNIGAAAGDAAVAAGTLEAAFVSFGAGTGTINFNHTDTDYDFDAAISGAGSLNQIAGVTNLTGDSSGFTGATSITGGTLNVTGSLGDSNLQVDGGSLSIQGGGAVSDHIGYLGGAPGTTGRATVTGENSTWTNDLTLYVGYSGTGVMTVADGGTVSSDYAFIGHIPLATGSVTVTGENSAWISMATINVGYGGNATLTVDAGGAVSDSVGYIAYKSGATGAVTVTGEGSTWTNASTLSLGYQGDGSLTIADGGAVAAAENVTLASSAGSSGTLNIGAAAGDAAVAAGTLDAAGVAFGAGVGTINFNHTDTDYDFDAAISGEGTINQIAGITHLTADSAAFTGDTNVSGGTLVVGNALGGEVVTVNGGTLSIEGGGLLENTVAIVGGDGNSTGTVTVTGSGSTWTNSSSLTVGNEGAGTLNIADGGAVSSSSGFLGYDSGSTGAMMVTGTGSTWTNTGELRVGGAADGTLTIADGGAVRNTNASIGGGSNSTGTVTVTGATSNWTSSSNLIVGEYGTGTLSIADGGGVTSNTTGVIGANTGSTGTVSVADANSTWTNFGKIVVGNLGTGTLTVSGGGTVTTNSGGGTVSLAVDADSTGTLNIGAAAGDAAVAAGRLYAAALAFGVGDGVLNFNHTDAGYDFGAAMSGTGALNQIAGVTNLTGDSSGFTGATNITGGTLKVNDTLGGTVNVTGGTLGGSGALSGNVAVTGGAIAPGNSPGTLTIGGDLALAVGASLDFQLGSPSGTAGTDSDLIDVGGNLTLDGTLNVADAGGFGAGLYRLINYGGTLTDDGLDIGAAPAGYGSSNLIVQTATAGQVNLLAGMPVTSFSFWDGANTGANSAVDGGTAAWTVTGTNWTNADGSVNGAFDPAALLIFAGTPGTVTVDDGAGAIALRNGMQFAVDGYTVSGDAVGLTGANVIRVGDGTAAGAGYTATIAAPLTGTGSLEKTDLGTLVLTGANTYTGGTIVNFGTLAVDGGSISHAAANLIVGNVSDADGALSIEHGGTVSNASGFIGDVTGGVGSTGKGAVSVTGAGSTWTNAGELNVGFLGTGTLTIAAGGSVSNTQGLVGGDADSTGAVTVTGPGSSWANSGDLHVGNSGAGTLTIENGGAVSNAQGYIGSNAGSTGTVTVTGTGSTWTHSLDLIVGSAGSGMLTVADGGTVSSRFGVIGDNTDGAVTVTGENAAWTNSLDLYVGTNGSGTLTVADGGTVSNDFGIVGYNAGSTGAVTVTGASATWTNASELVIGNSGNGTLTIGDGGTVAANGTVTLGGGAGSAGTLNIGAAAGDTAVAAGRLNVAQLEFGAGAGTVNFNHTDTDYDFDPAMSGTGSLNQIAGVTRLAGDSSGFTGTTTITGGTLRVNNTLGGAVNVSGGTLGGSGTVSGDVAVTDGTIAPGNSPGTLTIGGDLALASGSSLDFQLGSPSGTAGVDSDLINVGGNLTLDGTLNVADAGGFGSGLYRLVNYGGTLTDNGLEVGAAPAGFNDTNLTVQTAMAGQVNLLVGTPITSFAFWDGANTSANNAVDGGSATWTAAGTNWTTADGRLNGVFDPSALLIFAGTAGTVTVDGSVGSVTLRNGLQFAIDGYAVSGGAIGLAGANVFRVGDGTSAGAGYTATIASSLTGTGSLEKTDLGTLVLTGVNSYSGGTSIAAGTLIGTTTSLQGDIVDNATLTFDQASAGTYAGAISGTGALTKDGAGAVTLTGVNSYSGGTSIAAGTLIGTTTSLQGDIVDNATLTFDQASAGTYAGAISGTGALAKSGAGELILTGDSSAYAGTTDIAAGLLAVNGALGGAIHSSGGTLGGSGMLGDVTIAAGGTLAPGNSIGTLNVATITMNAGSTYAVQLDDGGFAAGTDNDLLNVTGTATIDGGAVHVTPENGADTGATYTPGTYTILTAAGGVTGTFDALTDDYAFLDFTLGYDANHVLLTSSLASTGFCLAGMTGNQCAAGNAAFSQGAGQAIFDAVLPLSNAAARSALDQLSGELHASARTALLQDGRFAREAALGRLDTTPGAAGPGAGQAARESAQGTSFWAQGFGAGSHWDGDRTAADAKRNIGGLFIGGDTRVADGATIGLMAGYSRSTLHVDDRTSSAEVKTRTLGAYVGDAWGDFSLKGGVARGWHALDTSRSIVFTGFADRLHASYKARTFQTYAEAAYGIQSGKVRFEPFANAAYETLHTGDFGESGAAAALAVSGQDSHATFSTLGVRAESPLVFGERAARLAGSLGWRRAYGGTPTATQRFASGGDAFIVDGIPLARNVLAVDAGFQLDLTESATMSLSYNGQFGSGISDNGARLGVNVAF